MASILVLHGPNLNLLGKREPGIYGCKTLLEINEELTNQSKKLGYDLESFQSNTEGLLIDKLQTYPFDFLIFNPAAYAHTSIALRDALLAMDKPFAEVHLSNIFKRESFRQKSYISDLAVGVISGFGAESYMLALQFAHHYFQHKMKEQTPLWICEKSEN